MLCGCEACSFTLNEERKLKLFENRTWGQYLGPKRVTIGSGEVSQ